MNRQVSLIVSVIATLLLLAHAIFCWASKSALTPYAVTVAVIALLITVFMLVVFGKEIAEGDGPIW